MEPNASTHAAHGGSRRQRELVLAAVAIGLVATAAWRIRSPGPLASPAAIGSTAPAASNAPPQQKNPGTNVDLESLKGERPVPVDGARDPFRFKPRSAPPPPSPSPGTGRSPQQANPLISADPLQPPPLPPIPMKFIGTIGSTSDPKFGRVAVLSDGRGVYHGREGDVIEGRYRIVQIGVESIVLAYLDGRGQQTIAKTGQ